MIDKLLRWEDTCSDNALRRELCLEDITLKVPMGEFPVGAMFAVAEVDFENGMLTLVDGVDVEHNFKMKIVIG
jgi:hypothetical protein